MNSRHTSRAIVVDDEPDIRELVELTLLKMGMDVECVGTVSAARSLLDSRPFDLCLTDMRLPDGVGLDVVRHIAGLGKDIPVAVITAYGSAESAVSALKAGAFDYLTKPLSVEQLRALVRSALALPSKLDTKSEALALVGTSVAIEQIRLLIGKLARSHAPVYISGESGCGKELAARLIHAQSPRNAGPFVAVNCGAIPENLMESEFFGYRKGAFTGAESDRDGFFKAASGGTLFLDEVADLPLPMQVKLLRAIQERSVRKVGATTEEAVDARIFCATHQSLQSLVEKGRFRQDLYYRLAVIELRIPPLRERREDVRPLAEAFLQRMIDGRFRSTLPTLLPEAWKALEGYGFPGNVRELENILERACALSGEAPISSEDLQLSPTKLQGAANPGEGGGLDGVETLPVYLDRLERAAILEALENSRFNRTAAAKRLGITFRALRYRMERLDIR